MALVTPRQVNVVKFAFGGYAMTKLLEHVTGTSKGTLSHWEGDGGLGRCKQVVYEPLPSYVGVQRQIRHPGFSFPCTSHLL